MLLDAILKIAVGVALLCMVTCASYEMTAPDQCERVRMERIPNIRMSPPPPRAADRA